MSEIFRIEKRNDFTIVRNGLLRDRSMTLKAKGLLITMLSKPDGWDYTLNGLQTILFEGRDAIASGLTELERHGYLVRRKTRDRFGRFTDVEYIIYEYPVMSEPDSAEPVPAYPETENPDTDEPVSENPPELNKDINKKRNNQETNQASIHSVPSAELPKRNEDEGICTEVNGTAGVSAVALAFLEPGEEPGESFGIEISHVDTVQLLAATIVVFVVIEYLVVIQAQS